MAAEPLFFDDGFLNIFKPPGMTSHDVVGWLRRGVKPRRVGHGGTLDPLACGVLVCMMNKATKLSPRMTGLPKRYRAAALFGVKTDTGDAEGAVIERADMRVTAGDVDAALGAFTGEIQQVPPMMSALKSGGVPLYKMARRGVEVERKPRTVNIYSLSIVNSWMDGENLVALLDVGCSGGTYIRTLVEDIGAALGTVATTAFLIRTAVGPFKVEDAVSLESITPETIGGSLISCDIIDGNV